MAAANGLVDFGGSDTGQGEGESSPSDAPKVTLADRFLIPPFSVLDARQGYWQDRKRAWLALGIQSELGRGDGVTWNTGDAIGDDLNGYREQKKNGLLGFSEQARGVPPART